MTAGAGYTVGAPASATGTITNDDTDVSVAVSPLSTTEDGAGNLVYTFTQRRHHRRANGQLRSAGRPPSTPTTRRPATTFTLPTRHGGLLAGSSTATVTVDPTADNTVEPDETVILTVAAGTGYNVGAPSVATGTITNDDSSVSVAVAPSTVDEDGDQPRLHLHPHRQYHRRADGELLDRRNADFSTDYTQTGAATFTRPRHGDLRRRQLDGDGDVDPSADATRPRRMRR